MMPNCDAGYVHSRITRFPKNAARVPQGQNPQSYKPCGSWLTYWRRGWDSNPRYGKTVRLISSQVHSTTLPPLREARILPATSDLVQNDHMRNPTRCVQTVIASLLLLLSGCNQQILPWNGGKLVVIVPEAGLWPESEFQRELARLFAEQLHASLELIPLAQDEIPEALRKHLAHLAAVPFRSESNPAALQFGPTYQSVREVLVCNSDMPRIKSLADLKGKEVMVAAGSAHEAALREAQRKLPSLQWLTERDLTTQDLLAEVGDGSLDCAAANELQFADARNYHPNLVDELDIVPPSNLAWVFPGNADSELLKQVQIFFTTIQHDGTLHHLLDRYYGHSSRLDKMDAAAFITRTRNVLPRYRHIFDEAATLTGIDWRLLAALSYQESQWDPLATSYTNVRGMMMLTGDTADQMKVSNRLNPRESILAGAKYLLLLKEQLPRRIHEPDRTWLALAAYNQGYSHLQDARILTRRAGLNPDSWADVKRWMPLLNRPKYYKTLKHGYARGGEAVILVESIRSYYDMLKRLEPEKTEAAPEVSYRLVAPMPMQRLLP
jgi:membrane-bound lytic murein transglycosylase F